MTAALGVLALGGVTGSAQGQVGRLFQRTTALEHARILTMDGRVIEDGTIVFRGSSIQAVGLDVPVPDNARRLDATGLTITPGLIDAWGALAMTGGATNGATNLAFDAFDRYATDAMTDVLRHGVTSVYVPARASGGIGGTGAVVRLDIEPRAPSGEIVKEDVALCIDLASDSSPVRRLQTFDNLRSAFRRAKDYREAVERYEQDELPEYLEKLKQRAEAGDGSESGNGEGGGNGGMQDDRPRRRGGRGRGNEEGIRKPAKPGPDRDSEVLLRAIDREIPVRITADHSADILNAIELADEFGLDIIIESAAEAHLVADEIESSGARVVFGRADHLSVGRDFADLRAAQRRAATLNHAGIEWAIGSGVETGDSSRFVLANAQLIAQQAQQAAGVTIDPLELVTVRAAKLLGVDSIGRLRRGADADLVLWRGDPLDPAAEVVAVYVQGSLVFGDAPSAANNAGGRP